MKIEDCRVLITGASGGIGQAVADELCRQGAHLLVAGRRPEPLEALSRRFPGQVELVQTDIHTTAGRDAVQAAVRRFGGMNCLINAAGTNRFSLLEHHDEEAIAELIGLNVTSTLQLTHRLLRELCQREKSLVLNLGSTFGSIGYPGFSVYCASKFALRGFSEALRRELADTRVKVLYVAPRATRTPMNSTEIVAMNAELGVTMDEASVVAAAVVKALRDEREELFLGWPEKLFVRLNNLLPRQVDQALRKQLPVIKRFARTRT
ncbi:SDR family oxidoreductase [Aromatoleum buckelii]|uniref:SDR family oxidoreductase n=1 Tax=Aromatoleum buckelii TaxID=200254 RepID=A0ABX1MZW3_9RHOO|nr:SDR family oxidoreductase [Aromatoleum buckelii]MCK0512891.1 SDR family oxidoreductase [Aromatoleum buckelii]